MPEQEMQLTISTSPHLRSPETVSSAMRDVLIALLPVTLISIYMYRWYAVFLIAVSMVSAALFELLFRKIMKKQATLHDCSALVTGLLLALCLRPGTPWWTVVLGAFFAVGIAKELMGGLGWNRFNPALFGLAAVTLLAPLYVGTTSTFAAPLRQFFGSLDVITQATPLALLKQGLYDQLSLSGLLIASPGGALGETSALALIIGGAYLLYKKQIRWQIPASMIATGPGHRHFLGKSPGEYRCGCPALSCPCRRAAAGRLLHGYRLGNQPHHGQGRACLRYRHRDPGYAFPESSRSHRGGSLLHTDHECFRAAH